MATSNAKRPRLGDRTMLACVGCKQKKLKCDGQTPKCQNCARNARDCLVEDPATGLLRPRDYMQCLEARVAYLEGLLRQSRPDVAVDHFEANRTGDPSSLDIGAFSSATPLAQQSQADQMSHHLVQASSPQSGDITRLVSHEGHDDGNDLASEVALLALSAAGREPQYFGPSSALSFARIAGTALGLQKRHEGSQLNSDLNAASHPNGRTRRPVEFPPAPEAHQLSKAFFNNIHPQYPFLHRPTFQTLEEQCLHANQMGNLQAVSKDALFFVLIVYAIGSSIADNGDQSSAEAYYLSALDNIQYVIDMDSLESVQALLACAVYSIRSPVGASIWKLSGMAIRHCIELGYHRNTKKFRPHADALSIEMSKRVFWVAYDIDRAAAFALGRPFGIPDEMIDTELPLDIDDSSITTTGIVGPSRTNVSEPPTALTGAIHIVKLRRIWSKISDSLYSASSKSGDGSCAGISFQITQLRSQLDDWDEFIPIQPQSPDSGPITVFASRDWFRLAYCHSIILLYRHYFTCTAHRRHMDQTSVHCTREAIDAAFLECAGRAREMCLLYRRTYQRSPVRYTWGSLHILFLGGLTYLHCLWSSEVVRRSTRQVDAINTCTACTMVLVIIAERWSNATLYRDIFEELAERTIEMICGGPGPSNENKRTSVRAFGTELAPLTKDTDLTLGPAPMAFDDSQLDEWIMNLEQMNVPDESEWLVQDLLRGFGDQQDDPSFQNLRDY